MRNISFALTTQQFLDGSKTVTRRLGWSTLGPGDVLMAVEKSQGLKKGRTVKRLGPLRILAVKREPLSWITQEDVQREGFPDWTPLQFIVFFCATHGCKPDWHVTRIEFERIHATKGNGDAEF